MFDLTKDGKRLSSKREEDPDRSFVAGELYRVISSDQASSTSEAQKARYENSSISTRALPAVTSSDSKARDWNAYVPQTVVLAGGFYFPPSHEIHQDFRIEKVSNDSFEVRIPVRNVAGRFYPSMSQDEDALKASELKEKLKQELSKQPSGIEIKESWKKDEIRLSLIGLSNGGFKPMGVTRAMPKSEATRSALAKARALIREMIRTGGTSSKRTYTPPHSDPSDSRNGVVVADAEKQKPQEQKKKVAGGIFFPNRLNLPSFTLKVDHPPAPAAAPQSDSAAAGSKEDTPMVGVETTRTATNVPAPAPASTSTSAAATFFGGDSLLRKRPAEEAATKGGLESARVKKFKLDEAQSEHPKPSDPRIGVTHKVASPSSKTVVLPAQPSSAASLAVPQPSKSPSKSAVQFPKADTAPQADKIPSKSSNNTSSSSALQGSDEAPKGTVTSAAQGTIFQAAVAPIKEALAKESPQPTVKGSSSTAQAMQFKPNSASTSPPVIAQATMSLPAQTSSTSAPVQQPSITTEKQDPLPSTADHAILKPASTSAVQDPASSSAASNPVAPPSLPSKPTSAPLPPPPTSHSNEPRKSIPVTSGLSRGIMATALARASLPAKPTAMNSTSPSTISKPLTASTPSEKTISTTALIQSKFIKDRNSTTPAAASPAPSSTSSGVETPVPAGRVTNQAPSPASTSLASPSIAKPRDSSSSTGLASTTTPAPKSASLMKTAVRSSASGSIDQEKSLPEGWSERRSRTTNEVFYYHKATKQVSTVDLCFGTSFLT